MARSSEVGDEGRTWCAKRKKGKSLKRNEDEAEPRHLFSGEERLARVKKGRGKGGVVGRERKSEGKTPFIESSRLG